MTLVPGPGAGRLRAPSPRLAGALAAVAAALLIVLVAGSVEPAHLSARVAGGDR